MPLGAFLRQLDFIMKRSAAFGLLEDLKLAIQSALLPTFWELWRTPTLLFTPIALSRHFMAHVWVALGNGIDEAGKNAKLNLIPANASGIVLDIGAG